MKRTKIVCTIGPASEKQAILEAMIKAGMNVARLNMSHGAYAWHSRAVRTIRRAAHKVDEPVALLLDLQGPKVRVGELGVGSRELKVNEKVVFSTGVATKVGQIRKIPIDYKLLHKEIKKGHRILLADGLMECVVENIKGQDIEARVRAGGVLISHKGINLPDTVISLKALTPKDKKDLVFGIKLGVDFMAFSFARSAKDVKELRQLLEKGEKSSLYPPLKKGETGGFAPIKIIVKIEKHEAVKNFDAILAAADGIMVARGDLALEIDSARLPLVQKEIIIKCRKAGKPVIVATEMLGSMEKNPRPTRAEITDVANAVIDHTDAVMLSAESAMGKYPVQTVATMAKIIKETEASRFDNVTVKDEIKMPPLGKKTLLDAVVQARQEKAKALAVFSLGGQEARLLSRFRAEIPIIAGASCERVVHQMNLSWGVYPEKIASKEKLLTQTKKLLKLKHGKEIVEVK